jgi:DMSO/TMAO reductase YedYZ molybdopterin-dependent catalytic subunit
MVQVNGYAVNAETPLELLTGYLKPNHPPDVHGSTLSVDGAVATAMQLTGSDLRRLPVTEVTCPLAVN